MIPYQQQEKGLFTFYKEQQQFIKNEKTKKYKTKTKKKVTPIVHNFNQSKLKNNKNRKHKINDQNPSQITFKNQQLNSPQITKINKTYDFLKQIIHDKRRRHKNNSLNSINSINSLDIVQKIKSISHIQNPQNICHNKDNQITFNPQFDIMHVNNFHKEQNKNSQENFKCQYQKFIQPQLFDQQNHHQKIIYSKQFKTFKKKERGKIIKTQGEEKSTSKLNLNRNVLNNQMLMKFQRSIQKSNSQYISKNNLPNIYTKKFIKKSARRKVISNSIKDLRSIKKKQHQKNLSHIPENASKFQNLKNKFPILLKKFQDISFSNQDLNITYKKNQNHCPIHKIQTVELHQIKQLLFTKQKQDIQSFKQLKQQSVIKNKRFKSQSFKKILTNPFQDDLMNNNKVNNEQNKIQNKNSKIKKNIIEDYKKQQRLKVGRQIRLKNAHIIESPDSPLQKNNQNYLNNNSFVSYVQIGNQKYKRQNMDWCERKMLFLKKLGINK